MRGVRAMISATIAVCQRVGDSGPAESSVICVSLLAPGIAVHMIAAKFPEPGLVAFGELQAIQPFSGLPEIQMRHQHPCRAAMIFRERATGITRRNHCLSADEIGGRYVGGIAVKQMRKRKTD